MDMDKKLFSQQVVSLRNLVDRFEGQIDKVNQKMGELDAMEEAQVQARKGLQEKTRRLSLVHEKQNEQHSTTQPTGPQTEPSPLVFQYVGPAEPVDITMEEVEESSKHLKRHRENKDVGMSNNPARMYWEWLGSSDGKLPNKAVPPAPSSISTFYSAPPIPPPTGPIKATDTGKVARQGRVLNTKAATSLACDFSNDDDYGSDTDTGQVMTLLMALVRKVNHLLDKVPLGPVPAPKNVHPIVAQHLIASGQRCPTASKDNFKPWDQNEDDNRPMDPVKCPVERVAALAYVQVALAECLGRKSKKDLLPPGPPDDIELPTREEFWVKWNEPYNSEFNTTSCGIVTHKIMKDFPTLFTEECYEDLFKMVAAHLKYNIVQYRHQHLPLDDPSEGKRLAAASSNHHRHTLFQKRMYIVHSIKELRHHRHLLKDLGMDGTSSNEEDPQMLGLYRVKRIKQLSSSVIQLKQKLDNTYEALVKVPR
ncbi:hypothetical protein FRC11_004738 [Ceratobasidium sp. 423]|nr:hypothetical protein FRC11_004738 [Ceratobasidium sp. 423]